MNLQEKIAHAEVVSFDIFDTLINRIYSSPMQLFYHLEMMTGKSGFFDARIAAEVKAREIAREKGQREVSLGQIYEELNDNYVDLMDREIELEMFACHADADMKAVYDETLKNKRVYLTSDMYLPRRVIEDILSREGFLGYERLLLSSEQLKTKADGSLYDELIACAKVSPEKILHIGDHEYTDIKVAQSKKIHTYHYINERKRKCKLKNSRFFTTINKYSHNNPALAIMPALIREQEEKNSEGYWYQFGFKYIGILALGYVRWLREQFERDGITKAFFMLRDGYIFRKVFEKVYPDFPTEQVFGSRRMFLFAGMEEYEDIKFHTVGIHTAGLTYKNFWTRLSIDDDALQKKYEELFPNQEKIIASQEELDHISDFLEKNTGELLNLGREERTSLIHYFRKIGLLQEKSAVVDLGWKASMLKGIDKICRLESAENNITGYYIGTHKCETDGLFVKTYALNNGNPIGDEIADVLNQGYVISILELAFSAPHPSVLKLNQHEGDYLPVYQTACKEEKARIQICQEITHGVLDFVDAFQQLSKAYPIEIDRNAALVPLKYLSQHISAYDKMKLYEVSFFPGVGADDTHYPISPNGMVHFGVVDPWPGDMSGEREVIARLKRASSDIGVDCTVIDDYGYVLNNNHERTDEMVSSHTLDFVITTQYETHKSVDTFYYHALWNPPEIPLNIDDYYDRVTNQYIANDDYLIYDTGGMKDHLRSMLIRKERTLEGASMLTASCPASVMLSPDLSNPIMFYCGMNWETVTHKTNRHEGLFKLLDRTDNICFYGPKKVKAWDGIQPWKGYKSYKGSIPFDGCSILKEINRCGVCLVLSSDIHRRAGAVTNRAYEACAAGAVMISDNNEFMTKWFKDAALFIDYNINNPKDTFNQIMEKYNWILEHKQEAEDIVKRAQKIFQEKFSLDKQLITILNHHAKRFRVIEGDLFAQNENKRVLVTYVLTTQNIERAHRFLDHVIHNIENQYYRNIILGVACDHSIYGDVAVFVHSHTSRAHVYSMDIFDFKGVQKLTAAESMYYLLNTLEYDYFLNTTADETWFYDHVTTLVRAQADENAIASYSGRLLMESGKRRIDSFYPITANTLYHMQPPDWLPGPGQILFCKKAKDVIKEYMLSCLDGFEHYAILAWNKLKLNEKLAFSRRVTFSFNIKSQDMKCSVLHSNYQIRFIRDLINEEYKELMNGRISGLQVGRREINALLANLPLKKWIMLRLCNARARRADPDTEKGKRIIKKYNRIFEDFLSS